MGRRIFLATGSKDLGSFVQAPGAADKQWFARVTADPDFIKRALELGLPRAHLCAMQGPFSGQGGGGARLGHPAVDGAPASAGLSAGGP